MKTGTLYMETRRWSWRTPNEADPRLPPDECIRILFPNKIAAEQFHRLRVTDTTKLRRKSPL